MRAMGDSDPGLARGKLESYRYSSVVSVYDAKVDLTNDSMTLLVVNYEHKLG